MDYNGVENFNLISGYASMFKKYAQFNGRSRRSEYWFAMLANAILTQLVYLIALIPSIMDFVTYGEFTPKTEFISLIIQIVLIIYWVVTLIPSAAIIIRRLHDTGKSGWWILLEFVIVGQIVLIVFLAQDSQPGWNKYGPNPKGR
ncbi:MAG: DUF805 domain-containing protein [Oscillospiraceae bacterium]|nr:DUF805 domain-containing protein [Oscillospiraceae bacterium]